MMESRMRYRKKMKWMLRFSSWIEWELIARACSQWMASGAPDFSYLRNNLRKDPHYWLYSNRGVLLWPYFVRPVQSSPNDPVLIPGLDNCSMEYYEEGRFNSSLAHSISPRSDKESKFTHPPDRPDRKGTKRNSWNKTSSSRRTKPKGRAASYTGTTSTKTPDPHSAARRKGIVEWEPLRRRGGHPIPIGENRLRLSVNNGLLLEISVSLVCSKKTQACCII